jgi:hypothetical protein
MATASQRINACWSWACVKRDGNEFVCIVECDGGVCDKRFSSSCSTNFKSHLKNKHKINSGEHEVVKKLARERAGVIAATKKDYDRLCQALAGRVPPRVSRPTLHLGN